MFHDTVFIAQGRGFITNESSNKHKSESQSFGRFGNFIKFNFHKSISNNKLVRIKVVDGIIMRLIYI